jgi:type IV secretory pathway VirB3-like protein
MPRGAAGRPAAFPAAPLALTVSGMLFGFSLHTFVVNGLAAMVFILLMKGLVAPHLPAGAQKLIAAA